MKKIAYLFAGITFLASCKKEDNPTPTSEFTVTIENVSTMKTNLVSGVFNTPKNDTDPGAATPGKSYEFSFNAGKGQAVSFATMFVQSNDLFYAPISGGIKLYDDMGNPRTGDVTSDVQLWDAGTEVNMEPGVGADQPPRQSGPNTGMAESNPVMMVSEVNDGFMYPTTSNAIKVMLSNNGDTMFTLSIENLTAGGIVETPLAPGVFAVHAEGANPLFNPGMETSNGLEALAEDGNPAPLSMLVSEDTGYWSPFAPGVFAVHSKESMPIFTNGTKDNNMGLEGLAEDGDPSTLISSLMENMTVSQSGVFNTPSAASAPGPLLPANTYTFSFTASEGDYLNLATMLVQSNDLFMAFDEAGIALFTNGTAISRDITANLNLWDAGTEVNEYPGAGNNQPLRQSGANTGSDENETVVQVSDDFTYPAVNQLLKISISSK